MTLLAGSVTVGKVEELDDSDPQVLVIASVTEALGGGLAQALYTAKKAAMDPVLKDPLVVPVHPPADSSWAYDDDADPLHETPIPGQTADRWRWTANKSNYSRLKAAADEANLLATVLVDYLKANALVTVQVSLGGLQKSTNSGVPTDPPASPVNLAGTIT